MKVGNWIIYNTTLGGILASNGHPWFKQQNIYNLNLNAKHLNLICLCKHKINPISKTQAEKES